MPDKEPTSEASMVRTRDDGYRWLATETVKTAFDDYVEWLRKPNYDRELEVIRSYGDEIRSLYYTIKRYKEWADETGTEDVKDFMRTVKARYKAIYDTLEQNSPFNLMPADAKLSYAYLSRKRTVGARTLKSLLRAAYTAQRSYGAYLTRAMNANISRKAYGAQIERFVNSDQFNLYTDGKLAPSEFFKEARRQANE